jgi:putative membrane protein (TIGR04086 family)
MRRYRENAGNAIYLGIGASLILSLALLLLVSVFLALEIGTQSLPRFYPLINYLAAVWGGAVSGRRARRRGYLVGGATGALWSLLLLLLSSLFGRVSWTGWWGKFIVCTILGAIGGIWGVNRD